MKMLSLFSGIGAFEQALTNLGFEYDLVKYCEIDKYASKSYAAIHNVSEDMNLGDITKVDVESLPDDIDLVTYGFPCQDISVSGKQRGLFDEDGTLTRSGLFFEALRIIEGTKPRVAIAENVKNLVGKKFKEQFQIVLDSLDEAGYNNYYQVLNAKDYGVPQNRERVFIVSIRKDIDDGLFEFPQGFPLELRLKDLLESEVDEKFYLDGKYENLIKINDDYSVMNCGTIGKMHDVSRRAYSEESIAPTIHTCGGGNTEPKVIVGVNDSIKPILFGGVGEINFGKQFRQGNRIYDTNAIAMCLLSQPVGNAGGNSYLYLTGGECSNSEPFIVASRGRNPENPSDRTQGIHLEQRLEPNCQGISNTLTSVQKDNYVVEPVIQKVDIPQTVTVRKYPVNTTLLCTCLRNHKIATGLSNREISEKLNVPVTKVEHWFRQDDCFSIPDPDVWLSLKSLLNIKTDVFDESIIVFEEKVGSYEKSERHYLSDGISPTLTSTTAAEKIVTPCLRIRKLTPKECYRLMGFDDEAFGKAEQVCSNTQLYKQAGNSIVVDVLEYLFINLRAYLYTYV